MFSPELLQRAITLLAVARAKGLKIATAESCTGGLIAALLTEIPGSSDVFERGFVTYSDEAKQELLEVPAAMIQEHGAVSKDVAMTMAIGALKRSRAHYAVAVTGIAGPGGGTSAKPVGLVYIAVWHRANVDSPSFIWGGNVVHAQFGDIGRDYVRLKTVEKAISLLGAIGG